MPKKQKKKITKKTSIKRRLRTPKQLTLLVFVFVFAVLGSWTLYASHAAASTDEHIISTLYAYPTEPSWQQVEQAAPTVKYAIVNICAPDGSGPGCNGGPATAKNPDWPATITALKNVGITPLYYISTNYGQNSISTMESDLQQSINWYGVASPHWDTMQPNGTCNNGGSPMPCTTYNQDLYNYAISQGATAVIFNPGTTYGVSTADIFGSKEIIEVFEGTAASFESTTFPSWMHSYSPNQFMVTLSSGTTSTIGTDVKDAVNDNIGNIYEDDEAEPPNYSTLPSFWNTEVKDVATYTGSSSSSSSPSPSPSPSPTKSTHSSGGSSVISSGATTKSTTSSGAATATTATHPAGTTTKSSAQPTIESVASTTNNNITGIDEHTLNPFIRVRDVLFQNYKGSKTVSDIGTAIVFLIPIAVVSFLLRMRLVSLFMRFTKFNKT